EPDGWMVVGLPTNFYALTGIHVRSDTLLGYPTDVRFTPVAYHWRYGDGTTRRATTPGGTWHQLGLREFDATPTSHIYREAGTYYIDLDIDFRAEYRIVGLTGWRHIP